MTNLTKLLTILSISGLTACVTAPKRPHGEIGHLNAGSKYIRSYDFDGFDQDMKFKGAPINKPYGDCSELQGLWVMNDDSKESLQAYALEWKQRYEQLQKDCK